MITKITRRKLRKLILQEAKLISEGAVSERLIEIEEAISHIIANTKGAYRRAPYDYVMSQLVMWFADFVNYLGGPEEFEDFIYDHLHVMDTVDIRTDKTGKTYILSFY